MKYTNIICGGSPIKHYIPTDTTKPFTLSVSPDSVTSELTINLYIKYGVAEDYSHFWIKTSYEPGYNTLNAKLRATFDDGTYEDFSITSPEDIADCYLSANGYKSWGYIANKDTTFNIVCSTTHTNSTTYPWINISGNAVTLDSNPSINPRCGDIFVESGDTLYIFSILQRPNEQSDYFIAPDQHYVPLAGGTRTVSVRSRSGKSIKRWWAYLKGAISDYYYGTGDNTSFEVTIPASETETSVAAILIVEDNDGKIWGCYGSYAHLFHQYSRQVNDLIYSSMSDPSPYQSFVAFISEGTFAPYFDNPSNHFESYNLSSTTENGFKIIDISVYPFGYNLHTSYLSVTDITWFASSDYFDVPVRLVEAPYAKTTVSVPVTLYSDNDSTIKNYDYTTGVSYSLSKKTLTVQKNTSNEVYNGMVFLKYSGGVLIPVVQEAYNPSPEPENLTLKANILGDIFAIGPYESDSWYVSSYPNWIHPSIDSGTVKISFDLDVDGNISESSRSGTVNIVYNNSSTMTITVNQDPITVQWDNEPLDSFRNDGGSWNGALNYNLKPDEVLVTADDWLNVQWYVYDDYLHIYGNVDPVGGKVDRIGRIDVTLKYLTNNGDTVSINKSNTVIQNGEDVTFYPEVTSVAPQGGLVMTTVTSQYPLTGYKSAISSVADVTFNRVSDTEITLYASYPMAEQGVMDTIMLIGDEGFDNIPLTVVTQSKFDFTWEFNQDNTLLSTDSTPESPNIDYVFGVVGYESSVDITDMTFTVDYLNGDDWITEITCDTNWQEVHIKAKDNRLGSLRRATITARSEQYEAAREFEVVQEGLALFITPTSDTIGANGGDITLKVFDANGGWIGPDEIVVMLNKEYVPFTYKYDSQILEVTIQVPANSSDQSRTLDCEVLAHTANPAQYAVYSITQSAFEWNMTDSFWISSTATTPSNQTAILTNQIPYTSIDLGTLDVTFDADWIRATGQSWNNGSGVIDITADDNRLGSLRRCTMTVYSPTYNKTKTVTIVQQGFSMSNQNSGYTIDCAGGDVTLLSSCNSWIGQDEISIKGQINGALVDLPFTINEGYITQNYTDVYVTLPSNAGIAREIEIQMHILALGNYFIFNVDQPSCDINIDTPEIHFEKEGGSREVYIEATGNWQIEVVGDWITVTPMNGSGEDVIEISVDPNNTQSDRTGYVYITNGIDREAIVITQGHIIPELYLKERYIKMPLEGGTTYVTLISNIDWTTEWEIQ